MVAELVEGFPCSVVFREAVPLDQHLPHTTALKRTESPRWSRKQPAIHDRRETGRGRWRVAAVRLQETNVEDVVDAGVLRQLEAVRDTANAFQHLERTSIARTQLALSPRVEGLCGAVEEAQPHPIAHLELHITVAGVVVLLGQLLRL